MSSFETIRVTRTGVEDDVLRLTIDNDRPLNAIDEHTHAELPQAFEQASHSDARVVVLTGAGEAFSAGGDIDWIAEMASDEGGISDATAEQEEILRAFLSIEQPVIARLNGDAIGLGATLALFADMAIAVESAKLGDPHVQVGLSAGDGGAVIWPLLTGLNRAKEYLLTGRPIPATEAVEMGLLNDAVPAPELDATVDNLIDDLATLPQPAVRYTKRSVNAWLEFGVTLALGESLALEELSATTPDHREAVAAFRDGRRPDLPSARSPRD